MKLSTFDRLLLKTSRKKRLLVMGDSHTAVFKEPLFRDHFSSQYRCYVETVGGATISGLTNPNSKTNAQALFAEAFRQIQPDVLITQIGEVDTGFVIWYRAQKYSTPVAKMLDACIQNYQTFLSKCYGKDKTIIISAPLPTIKDNQEWGEIANLRKEVTASQAQRTELTIEFNSRVQAMAEDLGFHHVNLDDESSGDDGLVAESLLNDDPNDHHYSRQIYLSMILKNLQEIF